MNTTEITPPRATARQKLLALSEWMRRHWKAVHTAELVVFFLMILLQLWGADMLINWHGWAIVMFGALFGMALVLRFPSPNAYPDGQLPR